MSENNSPIFKVEQIIKLDNVGVENIKTELIEVDSTENTRMPDQGGAHYNVSNSAFVTKRVISKVTERRRKIQIPN